MSTPRPHTDHGQAGFTLIETMVAAVLLIVGLVATLTVVDTAGSVTKKTRTREQATSLQRELVEAARSIPYDRLSPVDTAPAVRARPALADSAAGNGGWTIQRRDATYTVSMAACTVDDPRDGIGAHEAGVFCLDGGGPSAPTASQCQGFINALGSAGGLGAGAGAGLNLGLCGIDANLDGSVDGVASASATVCIGSTGSCSTPPDANPADYKRIISLVRWPGGSNLQTSQVNNPGLAAAPGVSNFTPMPALPGTTNTMTSGSSLTFTSTASASATTVALYRDGSAIGTASSTGGTGWSATWGLGTVNLTAGAQPADGEVVDGSYEISEKAFDKYGQYGATRSLTIVVNRRQAFAAANLEARRTTAGAEIGWSPAKEHDSEGFRVDRQTPGTGTWTEVCARALTTSCKDTAAPAPGPPLKYRVVSYDRDTSGALREGDISQVQVVDPAPAAPPTLEATAAAGSTVLTWTAPPLASLALDHYVIYRDGKDYGDRLASVAATKLTYTDASTGGQVHKYWVSAAYTVAGESPQTGPVER